MKNHNFNSILRTVALAALALTATLAQGATLFVTSISGASVQVIINGNVVRDLRIGQSAPEGVRLAGIERGIAVFEMDRQEVRLGIGQSTASQVVLRVGADGQFRVNVLVNGTPLRAVIDTGASNVALASGTARAIGIDYLRGKAGIAHTANGSIPSYFVTIARIQIGDIVLSNVPGNVSEGSTISRDIDVLIGNSFLRHVQMQRNGDTMVLMRSNGL